jgi:hypothetical protein
MSQFEKALTFMRFAFAGNATFTLVSHRTGSRYTYKLKAAPRSKTRFFVSTLVGADNENDYMYLGYVDISASTQRVVPPASGKALRVGSKGSPDDVRFKALDWFLDAASTYEHLPTTVSVYHEGRCGKCNRKLTVPSSIESGLGPECAKAR